METVQVGVITKAFGIKGEVKVHVMTDFIKQRFKIGNSLILKKESSQLRVVVKGYRLHQGSLLLQLEGYQTMDQAETLRNYEIHVEKKNLHHLGKNEYYFFDLKGCEVFSEQGQRIGVVSVVEDYPAQPVLRIAGEGKDILIPFIGIFIKDVDVKEKRIIVSLIEGMV